MLPAKPVQKGWSISALAEEFGLDRRTVTDRIKNARPCGTLSGRRVYALCDVAALLVGGIPPPVIGSPEFDPRNLAPKERKDYFNSEESRIRVEMATGHLIPASEVEPAMADLLKPTAALLETLPDVLERDCGLTPEQVEVVQRVCDAERSRLYELLRT